MGRDAAAAPVTGSRPYRGDQPEEPQDPFSHLFARRTIWLRTPLDHEAASLLSAELLALDRRSSDPIEVVVNSPGGPITAALGVIDTMDLLAAPITTLCLGQALGTAAAVLACGRGGRRATPTARIGVRLEVSEVSGTARELHSQAGLLIHLRDQLAVRLATATGQLPAVIVIDLEEGRVMTAEQAVGYGLIDEVAGPR